MPVLPINTLPPEWVLGPVPKETAQPMPPRRSMGNVEELDRRVEDIEAVMQKGFEERLAQIEFLELRLRELEERNRTLDALLQWGPIPGDRMAFTVNVPSVSATGVIARWYLPVNSKPAYFAVIHDASGETIDLALNAYDPASASEMTVTQADLSTVTLGDRVVSLLTNALRAAWYNGAQDWNLTQFAANASTVPARTYYEVEVTAMSTGPVTNVCVLLVLKQVGQLEVAT